MKIIKKIAVLFLLSIIGKSASTAPLLLTADKFGIYIANNGLFDSTTTMTTEADGAKSLGAKVIRTNSDMGNTIWPSANTWDFTAMDAFANILKARGMWLYYTFFARAPAWQTGHGSCQGTNQYFGSGTPGDTQCPDINLGDFRIEGTTIAQAYDYTFGSRVKIIKKYEIPYNEPDLSATTDTAHMAAMTAELAIGIWTVNPGAVIVLPALAHPKLTLYNGGTTAGATQFKDHHLYAEFLSKLQSSMTYINTQTGLSKTMNDFGISVHQYVEAVGGNQTPQVSISSVSSMSVNYGITSPVIDFSELNTGGGTPAGSTDTWGTNKSMAIVKGFAVLMSTNSGWVARGDVVIVHNYGKLALSITTGTPTNTYSPLEPFNAVSTLYHTLDGCYAYGDQDSDANIQMYLYKCPDSRNVWIGWTEAGSASWPFTPAGAVYVTDMSGATIRKSVSDLTNSSVTTSPQIVEDYAKDRVQGMTLKDGTAQ
jgi:hypothetical protein